MLGIHAPSITTQMVYLQFCGNWAYQKFINNPMGKPHFTLKPNRTVPIVNSIRQPFPAAGINVDFNFVLYALRESHFLIFFPQSAHLFFGKR
jgi:hypothetical protein